MIVRANWRYDTLIQSEWGSWMKPFIIGILAIIAALSVGSTLALSNDSYDYMAAASSVFAVGGIPVTYSWWPPLYPLVLAPFADKLAAAHLLNAVCLALTVALTLSALRRFNSWVLVGIGAAIILAPALRFVHGWVWSEPLFVALVAAWFALLLSGVQTWPRLVLIGLVAGLLGLQRYVGVLFVPLGLFALVLHRAGWKRMLVYALLAGVPLGLWMLRNILLGYPAAGMERGAAYFTFANATEQAIVTALGWLPVLVIAFLSGMIGALRLPRSFMVVAAYYVVIHTVFIIWSASTTSMDGPDNRLLSPIVVPLVYLVAALGGKLARKTPQAKPITLRD